MFLNEGYGATSMSSIADRLGGSKATLYKYFPSKEQLFEEMMLLSCTVFLASLREVKDEEADFKTFLKVLGDRYLRGLLAHEAIKLNRLVHAEGHRFPEVAAAWFRTGPDASRTFLEERLAAFADRGEIICSDPRLTAEQFFGLVRTDLVTRIICGVEPMPNKSKIDTQVEAAVQTITSGL